MKTQTGRENYTDEVVQGRIELMEEIEKLQQLDEPESSDTYREALSVDTQVVKKITLSTGGPADGFKLYFDVCNRGTGRGVELELSHGVYWRADWGSYKSADLTQDEAQTVYDFYIGGYAELI